MSVLSTLYDIRKTFEENFYDPPFSLIKYPSRKWPPKAQWFPFLGFFLASRTGAAPCAATTGRGIALLANLGFDVLTYKTIRRHAYPSHPLPNIVYVDKDTLLNDSDLNKPIYKKDKPSSVEKIAISNSFGNSCLKPEVLVEDIALAKSALSEGQILIVSVYGEGETLEKVTTEFAKTALFAKQAGADIIELNLSCPNLLKKEQPIYCDAEAIYKITSRVVKSVGEIPVIIKLGLLPETYSLNKILEAMTRAGAKGVSAINSISMQVVDHTQEPVFGERIFSGVSGYPLRKLALQFIRKISQINREKNLNLAVLGMGGITQSAHFNEFFEAGADIALSATGMMWNPYLAYQYHQETQL